MNLKIYILLFYFLLGMYTSVGVSQDIYPVKKAIKKYQKAMSAYEKNDKESCIHLLKKLTIEFPDYPEPFYSLGLIQYQLPNYKGLKNAKEQFSTYLELTSDFNPKHYVYYYLGDICYSLEDWECASKNLALFLKDVDKIKRDEDYDQAALKLKWARFLLKIHSHPIPFNPQLVSPPSSQDDEFLSVLSPDNEMLLFTRRSINKKGKSNTNSFSPTYTETFCFSTKQDDEFLEGKPFPYPFNKGSNEGGGSMSLNNQTIYVTVCKTERNYQNCDIYTSSFQNEVWSDLQALPRDINLPDTWEAQACIHPDGKTLYFVSDRKGGYGGNDIWYSRQNNQGEWGAVLNAGKRINTPGNEKSPFIHPDGNTFYFSSDAWMGMGGYDIFYCKLDDTLSKSPTNLGYPINSEDNEAGFFASLNGHYGYFSSDKLGSKFSDSSVKKQGGGWDIFRFELPAFARPEDVTVLKGKLEIEHSLKDIQLKIISTTTQKQSDVFIDTISGKYVSVIKRADDQILSYQQKGYAIENFLITPNQDIGSNINLNFKPEKLKKGNKYELKSIFFDYDSYDLSINSQIILQEFINFLNLNSNLIIEIQGYTDDLGDDQYNLLLSQNRAKAVYDYLIKEGVPLSRLQYKGYGKKNIKSGLTETQRSLHRKTMFLILDM